VFLKKRPDQLPKAPDLKRVKSFSLFGDKPATVDTGPASLRPKVPAAEVVDVIDVEVIDRTPAPRSPVTANQEAERPATAATAPSAPSAYEPEPKTRAFEHAPAREWGQGCAAAPESTAAAQDQGIKKPGLTIKSRKPGAGLELPAHDNPASKEAQPPVAENARARPAQAEPPSAAKTAEVAPAAPEPPQKGFKGLFGSKLGAKLGLKPKPSAVAPASESPEPATKRGLFGRRHKTAASEKATDTAAGDNTRDTQASADEHNEESTSSSWWEKARAPKTAAKAAEGWLAGMRKRRQHAGPQAGLPRQAGQRTQAPRGSRDLVLELENGKRVFWRVSKDDVVELDELKALSAISFSKAELRLSTLTSLSFSAAQDMALAELGEEARIVNGSRQTRAVYAITARRSAEMGPVATQPGLMLLDLALSDKREENQELLCALVLKGSDGAPRVAVLAHYNDAAELSAMQVTVNPDNLNFVLSQFAASRRLSTEDTQVVLLDNADVLRLANKLTPYPQEALWQGYSVRKLTWSATWVAMAVAGLCAMYGAKNYASMSLAESRIAEVQKRERQAKSALDDLLVGSTRSFAELQSLNASLVTERAGMLWTPGAVVTVDAGLSTEVYTVSMPLNRGRLQGTRPSILEQTQPDQVHPLLQRDPPEGCVKSIPELSGALNVVQITVTCESPSGALAAYRLD